MESSRPWESRGSAAGAPPQVSAVATPPAPAAQKLGEGLRRPCRGQTCGGMLGAMARIVACTTRVPPPNHFRTATIPFERRSARVVADILHCNKFRTDRRELLRIENYRKPTRMSRWHSRSVKGPPCGAGLAPWYPGASQATAPQGGQTPHRAAKLAP